MSVWQTPLGLGIINNPLLDSPYSAEYNIGSGFPPALDGLLTEDGVFILTEDLSFILTE